MGHEYVGIVEEVGSAVTTIKPGQFVVGSFFASDNTCEICRAGYQSSCIHREPVGAEGAQAELLRVPLADGTLVATPGCPRPPIWCPDFLAASDVLGTGWFGAVAAEAGPGKTVAVVGDGAVGPARRAGRPTARRGADHRDEPARAPAAGWPASSAPPTSSPSAATTGVAAIKELTNGLGAHRSSKPSAPRNR